MLLKVSPSQQYAYVFADKFILSFDIINNRIDQLINNSNWFMSSPMIPHALDVTDSWAISIGFLLTPFPKLVPLYTAMLFNLHPFHYMSTAYLNHSNVLKLHDATDYNQANDMSVAISATRKMVIVGLPLLDRVFLFNIRSSNSTDGNLQLSLIRIDQSSQRSIGFGRAVAWLNNETVAISVFNVPDRSWSKSEVWVFDVNSPFNIPLFVFPNNQQRIPMSSSPLFLHMLSWSGNLYLLTDQARAILVLSRAPGLCSVGTENPYRTLVFKEAPCVAGTYRNFSSAGPCFVCPPQTKNPMDHPCFQCSPCLPTAFCPMGSVDDTLSLDTYPSYTQTFTYPDSPDMNNYDDILVQNMFSIGRSARCLIIAPGFWTILAIIFCLIIWLIMLALKMDKCQKANLRRNQIKNFFRYINIVNDGERWIGGLFSLAISVIFAFVFWFSTDYLKLYPIETSNEMHASCEKTMRNALFDSALQLPLPNPDGRRWSIFEMLDKQPFTMTVDLVNTRASCSDITVQQNRPGVKYLNMPIAENDCILQPDNITRSVSVLLPAHRVNLQLNITGPYFVGGFRLCLRGPRDVDGVNTVHTLDTCQFFWTPNQTLSRVATLSVVLIKVVNQTKPLKVGDQSRYDGRWTLTFGESSLSDGMIYEQDGYYLRYVSQRTTLTFIFSEQPFFLQNNQYPIIRVAELAFHTLLFCTLIIELFAIAYLIIRLICKPIIQLFIHNAHSQKYDISTVENGSSKFLVTSDTVIKIKETELEISPVHINSSEKIEGQCLPTLSTYEHNETFYRHTKQTNVTNPYVDYRLAQLNSKVDTTKF
ncbi:unnamed protein product [Rotaria sp. Silwood2]|nr:unnamed protein product [Rotaria sp. Silwood2]CAF2781261.1 unnamed protein product [Rotaria sp. Silwood2]CAF3023288.1 unnamed protein product [Rotaria sp. Silwood2]CAF3239195.1 unnamed protein product [Rotaria sp. Silwood2]CAF4339237.1 unnamed protein product [Rotaria sp. Silwood2]